MSVRARRRYWSPCRQGGVALVLVLWIVIALTLVGTVMATSLTREIRAVADQINAAQARQAARAGASRGIVHLRNLEPAARWGTLLDGAAGRWHRFEWDGFEVSYRIFSEAGRIDINNASPRLIQDLLQTVGVDAENAEALTANLMDWRDPSTATRLRGTPPTAYRQLGQPEGRRDGEFESVDELRQVAGFDSEVFQKIAPFLTVQTGGGAPSPEHAPITVLAAHPEVDWDRAVRWARERASVRAAGTGDLPALPAAGVAGNFSVFGVEAIARKGPEQAHIEVILSFDPSPRLPFTILEWREPPSWTPQVPAHGS